MQPIEAYMGFLSSVWRPRGRRRSRPAGSRAATRGRTTKNTKRAGRGKSYLRTALDRIAKSLTRNSRSVDGKKLVAVYHHGTCTVNHRSRKTASRCRRTY
jgi:hypothetical protein